MENEDDSDEDMVIPRQKMYKGIQHPIILESDTEETQFQWSPSSTKSPKAKRPSTTDRRTPAKKITPHPPRYSQRIRSHGTKSKKNV